LLGFVEANKFRPLLDESHFTLQPPPNAYGRLASGKTQGKIVIHISI
jgi:hypothetical protein